MKALPILLACLSLAGCDVKKTTTPEGSEERSSSSESAATPKPKVATPKPTPKQGEWMLKNYKNPLEQKPR